MKTILITICLCVGTAMGADWVHPDYTFPFTQCIDDHNLTALVDPNRDLWTVVGNKIRVGFQRLVDEPGNFNYAVRTDLADFVEQLSTGIIDVLKNHHDTNSKYNTRMDGNQILFAKLAKFIRELFANVPDAQEGYHLGDLHRFSVNWQTLMSFVNENINETNERGMQFCVNVWNEDLGSEVNRALKVQTQLHGDGEQFAPGYEYLEKFRTEWNRVFDALRELNSHFD